MTPEEFIDNPTAQDNFIDRIASFLHITTDRIRIVGIK